MTLDNMAYMYPSFPIIGTISMLLCLYPVPAHWRSGNIATVSLALWTSIGLLQCVIDTCVWHGNIRNPYPIWGDIVNVYFAVLSTAIAGCELCIQYRLWQVVRAKSVFVTKREKGRQRWTTCFLCFGIPIILAGLHYVVQGHRYNLVEDIGPSPDTYNVTLAYPLFFIWEPILCLTSAVFGIMTVRLILKRRKLFDVILNSGSTKVTHYIYIRMLCLALVGTFLHLPLAMWLIIVNTTRFEVAPWISWEDTHSNYGRIEYINRFLLNVGPPLAVYFSVSWWSLPLCGITFFIFFGFGQAATPYQPLIAACLKPFGIQYPREKKTTKSTKRTWLDIILRRPVKPQLEETLGSRDIPRFGTGFSAAYTSGQTQTGTFAIDSMITVPQFNLHSVGSTTTEGNDISIEEKELEKDNTQNVAETAAVRVTFDVEAQVSTSEQWKNEIPERDPESTEEITF